MPTQSNASNEIVDSVTQSNITILASAPAVAQASSFQSLSHSLSLAMENATYNQQQVNVLTTAVTSSCAEYLLFDNIAKQSSVEESSKSNKTN